MESAFKKGYPTVEETLRTLRKIEQCTGNAAKLILLKHLCVRTRDAALEEAAKGLENCEHIDGCSESSCMDGCPVIDPAKFVRELKEQK